MRALNKHAMPSWMKGFLPSMLGVLAAAVLQAATLRVQVDPSVQYQTIDGFGASDAWRCQFVGKNWPLQKRERIAHPRIPARAVVTVCSSAKGPGL